MKSPATPLLGPGLSSPKKPPKFLGQLWFKGHPASRAVFEVAPVPRQLLTEDFWAPKQLLATAERTETTEI